MDWVALAQDAAVLAAISTAIFIIIDFIKKLYYKLPYKWAQKTPGEVWFALSMILGITAAVILNWNDFQIIFASDESWVNKSGAVLTGLLFGTGSKAIHAVASPAGAKLTAFKLENKAKIDTISGGNGYIVPGTGADALTNMSTSTGGEQDCSAPVPNSNFATPVEILPLPVFQIEAPKEIILIKRMKDNEVYVMIDGMEYKVSKRLLELDDGQ